MTKASASAGRLKCAIIQAADLWIAVSASRGPMPRLPAGWQLAQFSSVQALTELKTSFSSFQSNFSVMQSAGLIGKTVSAATTDAAGNSSSVTGTVKTISVINGVPEFTLADSTGKLITDSNGNPLNLPTSAILSIG